MQAFAHYSELELEHDGAWLTVWFNTPQRRNPLTAKRTAQLQALAQALHLRSDIRGVTLRGRGGTFCAGGDLAAFKSMASQSDDALAAVSRDGAAMFDAVAAIPQFTVAVAEGAAMAGGIGLLCACDYIIATPETKLALSEVRIGLIAAQIAPLVQARVGAAAARKIMLLGEPIAPGDAMRIGLVDEICESGQIDTQINRIKAAAFKNSPSAVSGTKSLLRSLPNLDRTDQIKAAADTFVAAARSDDGHEGLAAFAEKRPPRWKEKAR